MHARVATFQLGEGADQMIDEVRKDVEADQTPAGLEDAKGMLMLVDRSSGKSMSIVLFDDEEGLKRGDAALNEMSPGAGNEVRRTAVEFYEVPVQRMN
jgi:hypothetical protein